MCPISLRFAVCLGIIAATVIVFILRFGHGFQFFLILLFEILKYSTTGLGSLHPNNSSR
ncbi:hypothetical protein [Neomoorella mulderi]|uniref:hypothetical protein n=1 Tax=Neomoorella mulderi TaxID=202604 RepID=UPI001F48F196|nr:hypothetical protein [Moorella mulderi]